MKGLNLPRYSDDELIEFLKPFQKNILRELLSRYDDESAARVWLSSSGPSGLRPFGGEQEVNGAPFYKLFKAEFRAFICGAERYRDEREKLMECANPVAGFVVCAISATIATTLGVAVSLIVPAVALLLRVVGKMGVNAWCSIGG
ncbi:MULTISPECIES: hypothetical protein [Pseudomonas]|uniref:hypothetical protein n=1 Tax=Pseudomonas TaxID=286 RepID=UPI0011D1C6D4|nr:MULTISPECIES: hypothetical protein [Pseudomonas]WOB61276.1 hypothetical protein NY023_12765 [Pseudomonas sp. NBB]